jgi:hypothetical protein
VSSGQWNGNLGGLVGADAKCQNLAAAANLPGTYMAWLSTDQGSPSTRFTQSTIPYVLVNGTKVADNYADLTDGSIDARIDRTETGGQVPNSSAWCSASTRLAWTGTSGAGVLTTPNCNNFTNGTDFQNSRAGDAATQNLNSTNWTLCAGLVTCDDAISLYCFQQ